MLGFSALMLYGMRMVSGVTGAVVMSTAPAVTAAGSMLFLGERATAARVTAIALAVAGVLLLHLWGGGGSQAQAGGRPVAGSLLVFGAVCCEAVYTLLGKRMSEHADAVLVAFLASALAVPAFVPFAWWQWDSFAAAAVGARAWAALVWYGAGTLALGTWLWYRGLTRAPGSVAAAFMGVMPASALLLSYVLLGEPFRWAQLAGFAVVLAGVLLISREDARAGACSYR
jgi:drug/metabolite transporter (DMT)-like permease